MMANLRSLYGAVDWLQIHTKLSTNPHPLWLGLFAHSRFDLDHSPKKTRSAVHQETKASARRQRGEAARTTAPVKTASCNASLSLYSRLVAWPSVATPTAKRSHHGMDNASSD
jgi:hypothetical protein